MSDRAASGSAARSTATEGLVVSNLTRRFGTTVAVDDLSLHVLPGEVLALLGPSGCGKSTLLRTIAGLETPDHGRICWAGRDITDDPPHKRDLGLMFQRHALFTHRTVGQNIAFGPRMRGASKPEQQRRTADLLSLIGLAGFEHRSIESLSGGEAQRVALARALAPDPGLLLLDEPLGALDRALREGLIDELRVVLRALRQTTVHVTHDQEEAFALADRVAVMQQGRIARIGTPEAVWGDPQSRFVADFVGHPVAMLAGALRAVPAGAVSLINPVGSAAAASAGSVAMEGILRDVRFRGDRFEARVETATTSLVAFSPTDPTAPTQDGASRTRIGGAIGVEVDLTACPLITRD